MVINNGEGEGGKKMGRGGGIHVQSQVLPYNMWGGGGGGGGKSLAILKGGGVGGDVLG